MAYHSLKKTVSERLAEIRAAGLYKSERQILGPQGAEIRVVQGEVLNLCANNYLGLANHPDIRQAAAAGLQEHGYGMASVRFICGTQDLHKQLEQAISTFLGTEDTILYSSCFDANGGLFEVLLGEQDAVISDALNHASLIDGMRLSKCQRVVFPHLDLGVLEDELRRHSTSSGARFIVVESIFSMEGDLARVPDILELARSYDGVVVIDDAHGTGVLGAAGRGGAVQPGAVHSKRANQSTRAVFRSGESAAESTRGHDHSS